LAEGGQPRQNVLALACAALERDKTICVATECCPVLSIKAREELF
jgi:hypothetical protein